MRKIIDYEVIDYDENVSITEIARLALNGYEVMSHTDDWDLNWCVYVKHEEK